MFPCGEFRQVYASGIGDLLEAMDWSVEEGRIRLAGFIRECTRGTNYERCGYSTVESIANKDVDALGLISNHARSHLCIRALAVGPQLAGLTYAYRLEVASDQLRIPMIAFTMLRTVASRQPNYPSSPNGQVLLAEWERHFGDLLLTGDNGYSRGALVNQLTDQVRGVTSSYFVGIRPTLVDTVSYAVQFVRDGCATRGSRFSYLDWLMIHPRWRRHGLARYLLFLLLKDVGNQGTTYWVGRTILPDGERILQDLYLGDAGAREIAGWHDVVARVAFAGVLNTSDLAAKLDWAARRVLL